MRILSKTLAAFGAVCLLFLAYSVVRSPSGTKMALSFVSLWWLEPISGGAGNHESPQTDIVKNPAREKIADIVIKPSFKILFQSEEHVGFNGDGHSIVIAGPSGSTEDFQHVTSGLKWNHIEPGILNYLSFLNESTPYSTISDKIDPILRDPEATYFLQDLKRNGGNITNLTIYILSPTEQRLLEWSSDF